MDGWPEGESAIAQRHLSLATGDSWSPELPRGHRAGGGPQCGFPGLPSVLPASLVLRGPRPFAAGDGNPRESSPFIGSVELDSERYLEGKNMALFEVTLVPRAAPPAWEVEQPQAGGGEGLGPGRPPLLAGGQELGQPCPGPLHPSCTRTPGALCWCPPGSLGLGLRGLWEPFGTQSLAPLGSDPPPHVLT